MLALSRERLGSALGSARLPLCLLWSVLIVAHLFLPTNGGDDAWFMQILAGELATPQNWAVFLTERYHTWSSRVAIEGLLVLFVRFPILWRIGNALSCILLTVAVERIFNPEQSRLKNWILLVFFFLFPLGIFYEVGYVATTLNYLWPLTAILWAVMPLAKRFLDRSVANWEHGASAVALLFAVFQEQACAILFAFYLAGACCCAILQKRIDPTALIGTVVCALFLVYTFTCPGNANRAALEEAANFLGFSALSLPQKIEIGFSSMMKTAFLSPNVFVAVFCLILALFAFFKAQRLHVRILSLVPFATVFLCGLLGGVTEEACPPIGALRASVGQMGTAPTIQNPLSWLPLIFFVLLLLIILYVLCISLENKRICLLLVSLLATGAASRIAIGFSPTVWVSGERTCTFLYAAIAVVGAYLAHAILLGYLPKASRSDKTF